MALCKYQLLYAHSLTATGPSEMPQSAPFPKKPSPQAAASHHPAPPPANSWPATTKTCALFLPYQPATQHSFPTPPHRHTLFHSIPIAPSAVSSN